MNVVGIYMVRNEVDIIETNLRHHLESEAIDEAIVVDNESNDGTLEILSALVEELPVFVASEAGPCRQSEWTTRLARMAHQRGADWVLPIDADEFWVGSEGQSVKDILAEVDPSVPSLSVDVVNFVQRRDVVVARPTGLASMTMRSAHPIGPPDQVSTLVRAQKIGFVEMYYAPKCIHRSDPHLFVHQGNHNVGVMGAQSTDRITCLHAPLRAKSVMTGKLDHGRQRTEGETLPEESWHIKRLWAMAREHTFDTEWAACSQENGMITVGEARRPLVDDHRLKMAVTGILGHLRTTSDDTLNPLERLAPPVGAYVLALDTVPGCFDVIDLRVFVELDRVQREHAVEGHLLEIGAYFGKSAILLGHLARGPRERLLVNDVFEHPEWLNDEGRHEFARWYSKANEQDFLEQYARFHAQPPEVLVGSSTEIDVSSLSGSCRLVHVDGGGGYDVVGRDALTAKRLLGPGGIVCFGGLSDPRRPEVALAVWELVLGGDAFVPLLLTGTKLYGTWDPEVLAWMRHLDEWAASMPDLASETHTLAGGEVRRLVEIGRSRPAAQNLIVLPSLEELDHSAVATTPEPSTLPEPEPAPNPPTREGRVRRAVRNLAPPIAIDKYRRVKRPAD